MKTPLQHFSTRRLAAWQGESEFLQRSLTCAPDAAQAWWWKLRLRVLGFVMARYGTDPAVRARDHALPPAARGVSDLMFGERRTIEPRPRATLGAHLQSIAEANDFPRPPLPPEEDYRAMHEQNQRRLTVIVSVIAFLLWATLLAFAATAGWKIFLSTLAICFGPIIVMVWMNFSIGSDARRK